MELLLLLAIIVLSCIHILRIAIYMIAADIRDIEKFRTNFRKRRSTISYPLLSIIVPTNDNQRTIATTLLSVAKNSYPNMEIIVVDYGSQDKTRRIVRQFIADHTNLRIRLLYRPKDNVSQALNWTITKQARGTLIMCLDPFTTLSSDAAYRAVAYFQADHRLSALISNIKPLTLDNRWGKLNRTIEYHFGNKFKRSQSLLNIEYNIQSINATFRKTALKKINYFNETIDNLDHAERTIDVVNRLCAQKCRIDYGYDVYTTSPVIPDAKYYLTNRLRHTYGRAQTYYKNQALFSTHRSFKKTILAWFRLPYAVYGDILLTIEPLFAMFLPLNFLLLVQPQIVLICIALLTCYVTFLLMISNQQDLKYYHKIYLLIFAPFRWMLFYIITMLDYRTIIIHLKNMRTPSSGFKPKTTIF